MAAIEDEAAASDTFRFEDLPAELQVRIIEFAVVEDKPIKITRMGDWPTMCKKGAVRKLPSRHRTQPVISKVSKGIRAEALKAYYKYNEFQASYCDDDDYSVLCRWLKAIGEKNRALIKSLTIAEPWEMDDSDDACCFEVDAKDIDLRELGAILTEPEGEFGFVRVSFAEKKT